jgi:hypothetical protein
MMPTLSSSTFPLALPALWLIELATSATLWSLLYLLVAVVVLVMVFRAFRRQPQA